MFIRKSLFALAFLSLIAAAPANDPAKRVKTDFLNQLAEADKTSASNNFSGNPQTLPPILQAASEARALRLAVTNKFKTADPALENLLLDSILRQMDDSREFAPENPLVVQRVGMNVKVAAFAADPKKAAAMEKLFVAVGNANRDVLADFKANKLKTQAEIIDALLDKLAAPFNEYSSNKSHLIEYNDPEASLQRAVAKRILSLLAEGDAKTAEKYFAGDEEQKKLLKAYADASVASINWVQAMNKKFGDTKDVEFASISFSLSSSIKSIDSKTFSLDSATAASMSPGARFDQGIDFKKTDKGWKVADLTSFPEKRKILIDVLNAYTTSFNQITPAIASGQFKSADDVMKQLGAQLGPQDQKLR